MIDLLTVDPAPELVVAAFMLLRRGRTVTLAGLGVYLAVIPLAALMFGAFRA